MVHEAQQRAQAGDFAGAEPLFAQLAEARPNAGQGFHLLGQVRLKLGRFAEAREPLTRAAQFLPRDPMAQVNLAGCLSVLGEHEAALAALDRASRLKPGDAAIAHNRGRALDALGRTDDAERAYDEALSIDHRLLPSLSARARLLAARGDWSGALADLDMALTSQPDDAQLRLRRGKLLLANGDWMRGLAAYEARLELPGLWAPALSRWQGERLTGRLLLYPEQADIDGDAARRDTLLLARGIDATVQCSAAIADALDLPTVRRSEPLTDFAAAAPLRSLPHLLGWMPGAPPPLRPAQTPRNAGDGVGWFTAMPPPPDTSVERDAARMAHYRLVVGDDVWPTHLAARLGVPTVLIQPSAPDWLLGSLSGPSPWYPNMEVLREQDSETLAARLARC